MKRSLAFYLWFATAAYAGFGYYSPVTVNTGQVPSTQTDFPVLVSVTDARFKTVGNGGHVQSSSGFDIRPYSDSAISNPITGYELERYNATTGEVVMWVKRSSLADGNITYVAYGNSDLTTDGSSTSTWSNGFATVYHMADGTTLSLKNSVTATNGTNHSATASTGQIDGSGGFVSASNQYIDCGSQSLGTSGATFSVWVNATSFPNAYNTPIGQASSPFKDLFVKSTGKLACFVLTGGGTISYDGTGSHTLSSSTWYYLVMTYDSTGGLIGYVNAASDHTAANGGNMSSGSSIIDLGQDPTNAGRFWNGSLDEGRTATVARSADWITTEYNNQSAPGTFETLGSEQVAPSTATTNFFYLFP